MPENKQSAKTDRELPAKPNLRVLGPAPTPKLGRLLAERTFELEQNWLPAGLWPEIDALREEHHRLHGRVAKGCRAVEKLAGKFAAEDADYNETLRQAHREGKSPPPDQRTSAEERGKQRQALVENAWAALAVLAEHVERVVAVLRENEDEWLAGLQGQLPGITDKRGEIMTRLADLDTREWRHHRQAIWLKVAADDGLSGRQQPAPTPDDRPPSPQWHRDPHAFKRRFSKRRPWNKGCAEAEAALRAEREGRSNGPELTPEQKRHAKAQADEQRRKAARR